MINQDYRINHDYIILTILTLLLDVCLFFIILQNSLNVMDLCFIYNVFCIHFIFLYSLYYENQCLIDFCHYNLFLLLAISPFIVTNVYILWVCLFLVYMVQLLWIIEERCILNKKDETFGYGKILSVGVLCNTILLSFCIGKKY